MYFTYLPARRLVYSPERFKARCLCVVLIKEHGESEYLVGEGLSELTIEEARKKAVELNRKAEREEDPSIPYSSSSHP